MTNLRPIAATMILLLFGAAPSFGQRHGDPLTPIEIDQLRDTATDPELRLKWIVTFARARLTSLEQLRSDPKATDKTQKSHDLLQDFLDIYDELNDNLDMYVDRRDDIRKPLKAVIEADVEFQAKLQAVKDSGAKDTGDYQFVLGNAIQAVADGIGDHRQLLTDQEEAAKRKKKK